MRKFYLAALIAVMSILFFVAISFAKSSFLETGTHVRSFKSGGIKRSYKIYIPPAIKRGKKLPVVLVFHGGGGNGERIRYYADFEKLGSQTVRYFSSAMAVHPPRRVSL